MSLSSAHREHLRTSGLTDETIASCRFSTLTNAEEIARCLRWRRWRGKASAIAFPYFDPGSGNQAFIRVRPDVPAFEGRKYEQPKGLPVMPYIPLAQVEDGRLKDPTKPLLWPEGEKKAALLVQLGHAVVGAAGVDCFHDSVAKREGRALQLHPLILEHVELGGGRTHLIAFDNDARDKPEVLAAAQRLAWYLRAAGADGPIRLALPPAGDAKGIDDYYIAMGGGDAGAAAVAAVFDGAREVVEPRRPKIGAAWKANLKLSPKNKILPSLANAIVALSEDPRWEDVIAYDERFDEVVLLKPPPVPLVARERFPRPLTDADEGEISKWLSDSLGVEFPDRKLSAAINTIANRNPFDRVQEYLKELSWDGVERLDGAAELFGAEATELESAFVRKWLISMVARALEPGCQADQVLVLEGPQGVRKSSALRALCPDPRWFTDALPDMGNRKAAGEVVQGPWLVEVAELDAMRRAEVSAIKAFITAVSDRYRAAYARRTETRPRRCVFAATTNDADWQRDSTGGRRFWPVRVVGRVDVERIVEARDQLWAEAVAAYRADERWWIEDSRMERKAAEAIEERYAVDAWEPRVREFLKQQMVLGGPSFVGVQLEEILIALGLELDRVEERHSQRVGRLIKRLGWERRRLRVGGVRTYVYTPVTHAPSGATSGGPKRPESLGTPGDNLGTAASNPGTGAATGGQAPDATDQKLDTAGPQKGAVPRCPPLLRPDQTAGGDTRKPQKNGARSHVSLGVPPSSIECLGKAGERGQARSAHTLARARARTGGHLGPAPNRGRLAAGPPTSSRSPTTSCSSSRSATTTCRRGRWTSTRPTSRTSVSPPPSRKARRDAGTALGSAARWSASGRLRAASGLAGC